jgi:hypothetical protein
MHSINTVRVINVKNVTVLYLIQVVGAIRTHYLFIDMRWKYGRILRLPIYVDTRLVGLFARLNLLESHNAGTKKADPVCRVSAC